MKRKDVEIDGKKYQVEKLDAVTASWILNSLVAASAEMQRPADTSTASVPDKVATLTAKEREDMAQATVALMWTMAGSKLPIDKYRYIQQTALQACFWQSADSPTTTTFEPVMMRDGRWANRELSDNVKTVTRLITEVLQFNLSAVFLEDAYPSNLVGS